MSFGRKAKLASNLASLGSKPNPFLIMTTTEQLYEVVARGVRSWYGGNNGPLCDGEVWHKGSMADCQAYIASEGGQPILDTKCDWLVENGYASADDYAMARTEPHLLTIEEAYEEVDGDI